jgi:hypothetical protein
MALPSTQPSYTATKIRFRSFYAIRTSRDPPKWVLVFESFLQTTFFRNNVSRRDLTIDGRLLFALLVERRWYVIIGYRASQDSKTCTWSYGNWQKIVTICFYVLLEHLPSSATKCLKYLDNVSKSATRCLIFLYCSVSTNTWYRQMTMPICLVIGHYRIYNKNMQKWSY